MLEFFERCNNKEMTDKKRLTRLRKIYSERKQFNFSFFDRTVSEALIIRKENTSERLIGILDELLSRNFYRLSHAQLVKSIAEVEISSQLEDSEIAGITSTVAILSLRRLYKSPNDNELFENIIFTLRSLTQSNFETTIRALSHTDKILREKCRSYATSNDVTRKLFRNRAKIFAKKYGISQPEAAERFSSEIEYGKIPGRKSLRILYLFSFISLTALLSVLSAVLISMLAFKNSDNIEYTGFVFSIISGQTVSDKTAIAVLSVLTWIFLLFPSSECAKFISDIFFSRTSDISPIPALEMKNGIPDEGSTVTVITTLLFGEKKDCELFDRIEKYSVGNHDKNIIFGILADLPDSDEEISENDRAAVKYAEKRINDLNKKYGGGFCLFVRKRVKNRDGRFSGWERKRGAIVELVRFIKKPNTKNIKNETTFSTVICDIDFLNKARYIITLDSDTSLPLGAAAKLIGAMMHPANRPIISHGRVVSGHAVLQPKIVPSASSVGKTPFSVLQNGAGGSDVYATASYDTYQSIFEEGNFCGKGIFDIDIFHSLLDQKFPPQTVLSHDLLEGCYLRAGIISEVTLTDNTPKNTISFNTRLHRWIRGDVQATAFACHPLNALSCFKIWDNVRRAIVPIASMLAIILSVPLGHSALWISVFASLSYILLPPMISTLRFVLETPIRVINDSYVTHHASRITKSPSGPLFYALYEISALFNRAWLSLDAIIRSTVRMKITHRKMLEWTTAAEGDRHIDGISRYTYKLFPSVISGIIFMFLPHVSLRLLGVLWFIYPFFCYLLGCEYPNDNRKLTKHEIEYTSKAAADMWKFFEDYVTEHENHLPPDNVALRPEEKIAHRTSPTNIGLYLLSCLAARDFSFIDSKTLSRRITATLENVSKLPRWNGHLYNWYDTVNLSLLMPYISTVDSGNFVACAITLREGITEYLPEEPHLAHALCMLDSLINDADFSVFYNSARGLMYTGYDSASKRFDDGCYDLLMSECRTASYIAVARKELPAEHWQRLARPLVTSHGRLGVLSWSGTAFEYFMPAIFIPPLRDTLEYEALSFAANAQTKAVTHGVWGRSEGCYFAFDSSSNYCYRAFGEASASISPEGHDNVITPYSSFLMLPFIPSDALKNLEQLKKLGMYGKYGFYESVDFAASRVGKGYAVVYSYMSHHIGMSINAAANACFNEIMCKRFMKSPQMACASSLSDERVPAGAVVIRNRQTCKEEKRINTGRIQTTHPMHAKHDENFLPTAAILSDGKMRIIAMQNGELALYDGSRALSYPVGHDFRHGDYSSVFGSGTNFEHYSPVPHEHRGIQMFFRADNTVYPVSGERFSYSLEAVSYTRRTDKIRSSSVWKLDESGNAVRVKLTVTGDFCVISPMIYFEPIMTEERTHLAHPAYSALSVESKYIKNEGILIFKRRSRGPEKEHRIAVAFSGEGDIEFETRRRDILPMLCDISDIRTLCETELSNRDGVCIDPVCVMRRKSYSRRGIYSEEIFIVSGESESEVCEKIRSMRKKSKKLNNIGPSDILLPNKNFAGIKSMTASASLHGGDMQILELVMTRLYSHNRENGVGFDASENLLWKHGISGDNPMFTLVYMADNIDEAPKQTLLSFFRCMHFLFLCGMKLDLVCVYPYDGKYHEPIRDLLVDSLRNCNCEFMLDTPGGIYIVAEEKEKLYNFVSKSKHKLNVVSERNTAQSNEKNSVIPLLASLSRLYVVLNSNTTQATVCENKSVSNEKHKKSNCFRIRKNRLSNPILHGMSTGFTKDGSFSIVKSDTKRPWSHVLSGKRFGCLLTQNSVGFTWFGNSRERRLTPWSGDVIYDCSGETVLCFCDQNEYDLAAYSEYVIYHDKYAVYNGTINGNKYTMTVGVDEKLPVKTIHVSFEGEMLPVRYEVCPSTPFGGTDIIRDDNVVFYICRYGNMRGYTMYTASPSPGCFLLGAFPTPQILRDDMLILSESEQEKVPDNQHNICEITSENAISVLRSHKTFMTVLWKYHSCNAFVSPKNQVQPISDKKNNTDFTISTKIKLLDVMFNNWLIRQTEICRFQGRTGFYQSGGAWGFRDQLQDSLGLIYKSPNQVRTQLIRCCARQYPEGDVMHWWHDLSDGGTGKSHPRGVRTRCSDDYLWLPFTVSEYCRRTGDTDVLCIKIPYLVSRSLSKKEWERYESPSFDFERSEEMYLHCIRAFDNIKLGPHGLPLIGSCDWNDGMSLVGSDGKHPGIGNGESVWVAMFAALTIKKFLPFCMLKKDVQSFDRLDNLRLSLLSAVEKNAWHSENNSSYPNLTPDYESENGWYIRAFFHDGTALGAGGRTYSKDNYFEECKIDILPQAFSAMLGDDLSTKRRIAAVNAMYERLYDPTLHLVKLFDPPFGSRNGITPNDPGYIRGYPEGIRENGGQYTHAAVWAAWGLYDINENDRAFKILLDLCPALRNIEEMKTEPYAMSGDISTAQDHEGEGGWSLYTGAAAWYYRLILEKMIGYDETSTGFTVTPKLCKELDELSVDISRHETLYRVHIKSGNKKEYRLDGKIVNNMFQFDKKTHFLEISVVI